MLSLFRNKLFGNLLWVIFFSLIIGGVSIIFMPTNPAPQNVQSPLLQFWLPQLGIYTSAIIAFVLSVVLGILFNYLINDNEVLFRQSFFPSLFFVYLTHLFHSQVLLSPQLIASVFILLLIYKFLSLDPRNIKTTPFLDMGFFAAFGFCISPDFFWFIPALIIALAIAGYLSFKNILLLLTGISIPIYFLGIVYFLVYGDLALYSTFFDFSFFYFDTERLYALTWIDWTILGYVGFVLLIALGDLQSNFSKNTIRTRRSLQLLLLFFLSGLLAVGFGSASVKQGITLLALPLSPFLGYYFLKTKRAIWRETLFALFFIIVIIAKIAITN